MGDRRNTLKIRSVGRAPYVGRKRRTTGKDRLKNAHLKLRSLWEHSV